MAKQKKTRKTRARRTGTAPKRRRAPARNSTAARRRKKNLFGFGGRPQREVVTIQQARERQLAEARELENTGKEREARRLLKKSARKYARAKGLKLEGAIGRARRTFKSKARAKSQSLVDRLFGSSAPEKKPARVPHRSPRASVDSDLVDALRSQGYSRGQAIARARKAKGTTFDEKLRSALRGENPAKMTYATASAAARDAADRQAKKAGRAKWNRADYNLAVRTLVRLYPESGRAQNPPSEAEIAWAARVYSPAELRRMARASRQRALTTRDSFARAVAAHSAQLWQAALRVRAKASGLTLARTPNPVQASARPKKSRKRNSADNGAAAARLYGTFHGRPSTRVTGYTVTDEQRTEFAELGPCNYVDAAPARGDRIRIEFDDHRRPKLCAAPAGTQLALIGGNQNCDALLPTFARRGVDVTKDLIDLGECREVEYETQKRFDKFATMRYFHKLGEETQRRPRLLYDRLNHRLLFAGGAYKIQAEGIVD